MEKNSRDLGAKLATIELFQNTALGGEYAERDKTRIYVYCVADGYPGLELLTRQDDYMPDYRGYVEVEHPAIMAGCWEDCLANFRRAVARKLESLNLIVENDCGVMHWAAYPDAWADLCFSCGVLGKKKVSE